MQRVQGGQSGRISPLVLVAVFSYAVPWLLGNSCVLPALRAASRGMADRLTTDRRETMPAGLSSAAATERAAMGSAVRLPSDCPRFILGSGSSSRQAILRASGADFDVMVPNINERLIGNRARGNASCLVRLIAEAKADALLRRLAGGTEDGVQLKGDRRVLLTGDQVVTYRGKIREKPSHEAEARQFIASYAQAPCETVGAVCLHNLNTGIRVLGVHTAKIHFASELADPTLADALLADGAAMSCAGALMVEHRLIAPHVVAIEGGVDAVMGLSSVLLRQLLQELRESP